MPYVTTEVEVFVDLAEIESYDLADELERRGWCPEDSLDVLDQVVQAHRTGQLKIEGHLADVLIDYMYNKANKVI